MNLDEKHSAMLRDPDNVRNLSLYTPEGYSTDHKKDLENFSQAKFKQAELSDYEQKPRSQRSKK